MHITSINPSQNFSASFSRFGKIQYFIRLHRFPKAANIAMQDLRNCETDYVQITGLKTLTLVADRRVQRRKHKGSISPKFIQESISSMIKEAIENAADDGILEAKGETLLKQFPHRSEEITKLLKDENLMGLNEFARECNGL